MRRRRWRDRRRGGEDRADGAPFPRIAVEEDAEGLEADGIGGRRGEGGRRAGGDGRAGGGGLDGGEGDVLEETADGGGVLRRVGGAVGSMVKAKRPRMVRPAKAARETVRADQRMGRRAVGG